MEAMISWESSSVFTASARLATLMKSERGCESQKESGRGRRYFGGRESFTPGSRGRGGGSYCHCVLQLLCAAMVLGCNALRMAPVAPAMGSEQHWVNGRRERKTLAVIHCPWKEGYN